MQATFPKRASWRTIQRFLKRWLALAARFPSEGLWQHLWINVFSFCARIRRRFRDVSTSERGLDSADSVWPHIIRYACNTVVKQAQLPVHGHQVPQFLSKTWVSALAHSRINNTSGPAARMMIDLLETPATSAADAPGGEGIVHSETEDDGAQRLSNEFVLESLQLLIASVGTFFKPSAQPQKLHVIVLEYFTTLSKTLAKRVGVQRGRKILQKIDREADLGTVPADPAHDVGGASIESFTRLRIASDASTDSAQATLPRSTIVSLSQGLAEQVVRTVMPFFRDLVQLPHAIEQGIKCVGYVASVAPHLVWPVVQDLADRALDPELQHQGKGPRMAFQLLAATSRVFLWPTPWLASRLASYLYASVEAIDPNDRGKTLSALRFITSILETVPIKDCVATQEADAALPTTPGRLTPAAASVVEAMILEDVPTEPATSEGVVYFIAPEEQRAELTSQAWRLTAQLQDWFLVLLDKLKHFVTQSQGPGDPATDLRSLQPHGACSEPMLRAFSRVMELACSDMGTEGRKMVEQRMHQWIASDRVVDAYHLRAALLHGLVRSHPQECAPRLLATLLEQLHQQLADITGPELEARAPAGAAVMKQLLTSLGGVVCVAGPSLVELIPNLQRCADRLLCHGDASLRQLTAVVLQCALRGMLASYVVRNGPLDGSESGGREGVASWRRWGAPISWDEAHMHWHESSATESKAAETLLRHYVSAPLQQLLEGTDVQSETSVLFLTDLPAADMWRRSCDLIKTVYQAVHASLGHLPSGGIDAEEASVDEVVFPRGSLELEFGLAELVRDQSMAAILGTHLEDRGECLQHLASELHRICSSAELADTENNTTSAASDSGWSLDRAPAHMRLEVVLLHLLARFRESAAATDVRAVADVTSTVRTLAFPEDWACQMKVC